MQNSGINLIGYNIVRKSDCYSPIPDFSELKDNLVRWNRPSRLTGIEFDLVDLKKTLLKLLQIYYDEFLKIPNYNEIINLGYGPGYTAIDALTLYMMVLNFKPKRYIEVGAGVSTYYCSLAAKENDKEGYPLKIECIVPVPNEKLYSISGIKIHNEVIQNIDISFFQKLKKNDILLSILAIS